jgi:hypothetical protein
MGIGRIGDMLPVGLRLYVLIKGEYSSSGVRSRRSRREFTIGKDKAVLFRYPIDPRSLPTSTVPQQPLDPVGENRYKAVV